LTPFIDPNTQNNKLPKSEHSITLTKKTDERLIVVNEEDDVLDFLPRSQCHAGEGILHRAFSIHIFNDRNQILLQQRSEQKQLWPFHWSNSCCSHQMAAVMNDFPMNTCPKKFPLIRLM